MSVITVFFNLSMEFHFSKITASVFKFSSKENMPYTHNEVQCEFTNACNDIFVSFLKSNVESSSG